jgi:hypothetical protein
LLDWESARAGRQVVLLSGDVHAGGAFRVARRTGPGVVNQWTSSPMSTKAALPEHLANIVGSRFVNWGEDRYHSTRMALVRGNNFGVVQVTPVATGGHHVELSLYEFKPGRGVRAATRIASLPSA